jgi:hypothetical protein
MRIDLHAFIGDSHEAPAVIPAGRGTTAFSLFVEDGKKKKSVVHFTGNTGTEVL